jgi:hypothetical protein
VGHKTSSLFICCGLVSKRAARSLAIYRSLHTRSEGRSRYSPEESSSWAITSTVIMALTSGCK